MGLPIGSALEMRMVATTPPSPTSPAVGSLLLYFKPDGLLYKKDAGGVETQVGSVGGGGDVTTTTAQTITGLKTFSQVAFAPVATPAAPATGVGVYAKADGQLYRLSAGGNEVIHAPMTIAGSAPANPKVGDRWLDTSVDTATSTNFVVSSANPGLTNPGLWVQTGLGSDGTGVTFWIEDGT